MMKYFFEAILFAYFVAVLAGSSVKPVDSNNNIKKDQSHMINNYYAGPNCKKIEQQLDEIKRDIKALKENQTSGSVGNGLSPEVKQQLAEIEQGIRALNTTGSGGKGLSSEVKQQLAEIKQGIEELKGNQINSSAGYGLCPEVKQWLAEIKQEIKELKLNKTRSSRGDHLFSELKEQLSEIKQEIAALKGNQTGCSGRKVYKNCAEVYQSGNKINGTYKIDPDGLGEFEVFCDQKTAGGGWIVFQKRHDGSEDFYRGWNDYKRGFGNLSGEFWLGLDKIHRLTVSGSYKLRVDLEDIHGKTAFAEYSSFAVSNETEKYKLSLSGFSGTAGDSLVYHVGLPFTTKDRDNDKVSGSYNCAIHKKGAWWYKDCYKSNLNGQYIPGQMNKEGGMNWYHWQNSWFSLKGTEMKIRPTNF